VLKNTRVLINDNFQAVIYGHESGDPVHYEEWSDALLHGAYIPHFVITGEE